MEIFKVVPTFINRVLDHKRAIVPFCQLSISVSSSVSAKQQIPWSVSFLPWWEDCFFHQGQRQVANWAVAASPIPPPLHFFFLNHPATHKPTNLCTGTHTNENTLSLPMCTKAYSHIKSIKFTLTGLSHKENISPLETLTNNCGFKLFPLEGAFTH